ncbi:uncharacterized protein LOC143301594 [Babylonia areolata]|uniref:uncharacterized protein LOC143301594 n=1 Tax=Babylonia areolata TaxID=304850 RepID=UPI003FD21AB2
MAHYRLPYHAPMPEQQYLMASHYHDNRMTHPPELGGWMDQSDGGGKFQLKRRRRCGQCGPCQVKDNCNKCQYCLRKDILKQACVLRKCVYLRKPVPHSRLEAVTNGSGKTSEGERGKEVGGGGGGRSSSCSSTNQDSPHKPSSSSTPSTLPPTPASKPITVNPSAVAAAAAVVQSAELSSCQVAKAPFTMPANSAVSSDSLRHNGLPVNSVAGDPLRTGGLPVSEGMGAGNPMRTGGGFPANKGIAEPPQTGAGMSGNKGMGDTVRSNGVPAMNKGVCDPLRTSALEQHHNAMLNSCRMSYMSDTRSMDPGRGPAHVLGPGTNGASCGFGVGSTTTLQASPACSVTKDFPPLTQREQYRPPADHQWGPVPYGYSHPSPWATPPVSYGIHSSGSYYANSLGSSCQLGMAAPANHFAAPSQPAFPCAVPFPHPDFPAHANFHTAPTAVQSSMAAPFYPAPHMQIPSTLPNFPSFSQLPSSAGPHANYSAARAPVYPGSFYSPFRPSYEPQIYHVQVPATPCPFLRPHRPLPDCSSHSGNSLSKECAESEPTEHAETDRRKEPGQHDMCDNLTDEDLRVEKDGERGVTQVKVSSISCVEENMCDSDSLCNTSNKAVWEETSVHRERDHESDTAAMTQKDGSKQAAHCDTGRSIGEDLLLRLKQVTGRRLCHAGNCDDFKTLTSLRSDECCDHDAADSKDISDSAYIKTNCRLGSVDVFKHVSKCPRQRHQNSNKTQIVVKDNFKPGSTTVRKRTHQKRKCDLNCLQLHVFEPNGLQCETSPSGARCPTSKHGHPVSCPGQSCCQQTVGSEVMPREDFSPGADTASDLTPHPPTGIGPVTAGAVPVLWSGEQAMEERKRKEVNGSDTGGDVDTHPVCVQLVSRGEARREGEEGEVGDATSPVVQVLRSPPSSSSSGQAANSVPLVHDPDLDGSRGDSDCEWDEDAAS